MSAQIDFEFMEGRALEPTPTVGSRGFHLALGNASESPSASAAAARGSSLLVGDIVQPKPEWLGSANNIPSGVVRRIEPWGKEGALYVGDDRRAFAAFVFERVASDAPIRGL